MRRGHPGAIGWRGENLRPFRPRGSGVQNFGPSRSFGRQDSPRFPPSGPRQYRGPRPYSQYPGHQDNVLESDHHDRNNFRVNNLNRSQGRGYHNRGQIPPFHHQPRQNDEHGDSFKEPKFYPSPNQCHVNSMGDVDLRRQHPISPWVNPPPSFESNRQYYDTHRSPQKTHYNVEDDLPDYTGHRPPASDHYNTTGPNNNNSQYSHSVDDTVDIVRKRLQNRDKQDIFDSSMDHPSNVDEDRRKNTSENYQHVPQEQPVRKRIQRQKQNIKLNCDKMKNKIVHQLFKMDKTKIHKLMDDPSSSTKFEYAISSLITEGQNSLNRHLRSAAEKSLCSTSTDFIQDDTNTIYEDTFMKQMQGVLDPQDTVLLEDIKPLVMAELSRYLQLDDYQFELMQDSGFQNQAMQEHEIHGRGMQNYVIDNEIYNKEESSNSQYYDEGQNTEQFLQQSFYDQNQASGTSNNLDIVTSNVDDLYNYETKSNLEPKPLFERRPANRVNENEKRKSSESRHSRSSTDKSFGYQQEKSSKDISIEQQQPIPLFDPNTEQLSDEDDPFAELDKQYHVAVDHNFIANQYASHPPSPYSCASNRQSPCGVLEQKPNIAVPIIATISHEITKELDTELQNMAKSSPRLISSSDSTHNSESGILNKPYLEAKRNPEHALEKENVCAPCDPSGIATNHSPHGESSKKKGPQKEPEKHESSAITKTILQSNTRKRSTDQKPSHRKEKRKRSSQTDCPEVANSVLSMFYTSDNKETSKASKKPDSTLKTYSDKYVKRKEPQKQARETDCESSKSNETKKHENNTPNHSNISPKDNLINEIVSKSDPKAKLKPIDIFGTQPLKKAAHHSHRNTASTPQIEKNPDDIKPSKLSVPIATSCARKLSKRHIGTQVILKVRSRDCQTDKPKNVSIHTQTVPFSINEANDELGSVNPFERMKDIDMEIQLLLQEKFKLYNSMETKKAMASMNSMPNLSMTVFKVDTEETEDKSNDAEDSIVNDFANIPSEELEQIAMETIENEESSSITIKKTRVERVSRLTRKSSASPTTRRNTKKTKSPSISLIEKIITDDRPIEDIFSFDDLENTPVKSKRKHQKPPKKKSMKRARSSRTVLNTIPGYDLKECYVHLERIDVSRFLKPLDNYMTPSPPLITKTMEPPLCNPKFTFDVPIVESPGDSITAEEEQTYDSESTQQEEEIQSNQPSIVHVVDAVINDLQFDMLDVSEDIVIGDNCEVKTIDKVKETISEEIILDNSQSSIEDSAPEAAGADSECKMFDYSNESLRRDAITVTGNADAVLAIECIDSDFIAACLDGNVYHFNGEGQLINTLRGTNQAVTCLTIVKEKYGTTVYTGSLDSRMRYYDLETGLEKGPECNVLSPIQTMDRAWDTIFVGTRTGFVLQFECKNNMVIPVSSVKFSEQSILALRAMKEGPRKVLLVAARSENVVTVKDAQTGLLLRTLQGPKMTVYTLLYEDGKVYCGTSSHNIHVFDYTTGGHVGVHEGGKGAVCLRASGGLVFSGCYDGCVYVYREGEARALAQLRGPGLMLLSLAIHGTKIIAGYKDRGLYIWKMPLAIVKEMIL